MATMMVRVRSAGIAATGVLAGRANDLAHAGFAAADAAVWAPVVDELGFSEAGFWRMLGATPKQSLDAGRDGANAMALVLQAVSAS